MTEIMTQTVVVSLDILTGYCGFFSSESIINNYYNCDHNNPPDTEYDDELGRIVGCCFSFDCPVASALYKEDGYSESDNMMTVYDPSVRKNIVDATKAYEDKYGKILGYCTVNGITLSHLIRYRYSKMQFCMDEGEKKIIEEHLKDCPSCQERLQGSTETQTPPKVIK